MRGRLSFRVSAASEESAVRNRRSLATLGLTLALVASPATAQRTIVVAPEGVKTIGEAVRLARPGDRISVARGVYVEPTIVIDRPLTITGDPGAVLDGGRATHILRIEADDVTVRGLAFRNVNASHVEDRAAIRIGEVRRCRIEDNSIENAFFGIYLAGTTGCQIARNKVAGSSRSEDASGNGIHLWTARDVLVEDNRVSGHRDGIYLEFVHDSRVVRNVSTRNVRYGLHFMYSDDCRYERNEFVGNQSGVAVMYTRRVTMVGNRFEQSWGPSSYGLLLKEIYDSHLEGNRFVHNTTGLFADGATRMTAANNLFEDNGWAVKLMASTDGARLTGNTFTRNTFDVATNSRSSSNALEGNYWDEYQGYDLNRDGRGDVPHNPVRLFSLVVERNEPTMILLRSAVVGLLDRAERVLPSLTPERLSDPAPLMRRPR
jgi:nitrous oxidase accessory protein